MSAVTHLDEHRAFLLDAIPYTPDERRAVEVLFEQERSAILYREAGGDLALAQYRRAIAEERVVISRRARLRCALEKAWAGLGQGGSHNRVKGGVMATDKPWEGPPCPECGEPTTYPDEVDIGVGTVYGGRLGCDNCYWVAPEVRESVPKEITFNINMEA